MKKEILAYAPSKQLGSKLNKNGCYSLKPSVFLSSISPQTIVRNYTNITSEELDNLLKSEGLIEVPFLGNSQ